MMATPARPAKVYAHLEPPAPNARFGDLLQVLLDKGVRAPRSGKAGRPWQFEEFASHVPPLTSRQLRNIRNQRSLPHDRHLAAMLEALFGPDLADYAEWRAALTDALHRDRTARKQARKRSSQAATPTSSVAQPAPVSGGAPGRVPVHFHAREADLAEMRRTLLEPPHRLALHGAHGVGKTVVAAAYAERHRADYRATAWIDAETEAGCLGGLIAFGRRMEWTDPAATDKANLLETLQRLAGEGADCLIVFDNAMSPAAVHRFVPNGQAHILFTSNSPNWSASARTRAIGSWSNEDSARYLLRRLGPDTSITAARRLASDLGGLPLALELAASYCERRAIGIGEYRKRLAADPAAHLLAGTQTVPGYSRTVAGAYALSMAAASAEHRASLPLLQLLSFLAPRAIPLRMLDDARTVLDDYLGSGLDGDALEAAIAALRNHSLVVQATVDTEPLGPLFSTVIVHRLIALVSRTNTSAVADARETIARALILGLPDRHSDAGREFGYRSLVVPHVEHMLEVDGAARLSPDTVATLHGRLALSKVFTGAAPMALEHARSSLRLNAENHGRQTLPFATALYVLGVTLLTQHKPRSARIAYRRALAITARIRGEDHPDTAEIRAAIAEASIALGDQVDVEAQVEAIARATKRASSPRDPEHADMLMRLASLLLQRRRNVDALPSIAEATLILTARFPPDDDRLLRLRNVVKYLTKGSIPIAEIIDQLKTQVEAIAKSRRDKPEHVAAALMQIGIGATSAAGAPGRKLLDEALRRMNVPSRSRCWGLLLRSQLQPDPVHAIDDAQTALREAEYLDDLTAVERAARRLYWLLGANGRHQEADIVRKSYLA